MPVTIDGTLGVNSPNFFSTGTLYENAQTISTSYTITTNYNAMSAGPITIATGATLTIPTGSNWAIV
jgi:hypothetical protein